MRGKMQDTALELPKALQSERLCGALARLLRYVIRHLRHDATLGLLQVLASDHKRQRVAKRVSTWWALMKRAARFAFIKGAARCGADDGRLNGSLIDSAR